ncbi:MAG: carboxypeptidase-like regulatory domain-containing protein [Saprospiraceae bacterium]
MKNIFFFTFCFLVLFFGCKKNIDDVVEIDPFEPPVYEINYNQVIENINSSVLGLVVDEEGNPVEGATITLNDEIIETDIYGTFRFQNTMMNKQGTFIKIEKNGYFESGRKFFPHNAETSNVKVELLEKKFDQTFQTSSGGTVEFANGGQVEFSSNSIRKENGDPYSGEVKVALKWLNPIDNKTLDQMPGALQGVNLDGEEVALETYGMIAVELESPSGEALNIAYDHTAEIKMPVPSSIYNNAPAEIPLWSFNYKYGVWAEDGKALLQDGFYVGEVRHFSFWNCDYPRALVDFNLTLIDENTMNPMVNTKVAIYQIGTGVTNFGYTNSAGQIGGQIPAFELLELKVISSCNEILLSQNIGPLQQDVDFGEIFIDVPNSILVKGNLLNCDGDLVNDGMLVVRVNDNLFTFQVQNNPFEFYVPLCSNTTDVEFSGGDFESLEQSDFVILPVADSIYLGDLVACGQPLVNYVKITVEGLYSTILPISAQEHIWWSPANKWKTTLRFGDLNNILGESMNFYFLNDEAPGDFSSIDNHQVGGISSPAIGFQTPSEFEIFTVDEFGQNIGDVISGNMSGEMLNGYNSLNINQDVQVEFKVLRDF